MTFDIVGVVADSFRLAFRNYFKILGYMLMAGILVALIFLGMAGGFDPMALAMMGSIGFVPLLMTYVIMFCAQMACQSAVSEDATGNPVGFGEGLTKGISASPMAFVIMLICGVTFGIVSLIPMLATGGFAMNAQSLGSINAMSIVGLIATFIVSTAFMCMFAPIVSILVVEREGFGSFKRALTLTSGHRVRIFLSILLFILVMFIVAVVVQAAIWVISMMFMSTGSLNAMIGMGIFFGILWFFISIFFSALGLGYQGAMYAQLCEIED